MKVGDKGMKLNLYSIENVHNSLKGIPFGQNQTVKELSDYVVSHHKDFLLANDYIDGKKVLFDFYKKNARKPITESTNVFDMFIKMKKEVYRKREKFICGKFGKSVVVLTDEKFSYVPIIYLKKIKKDNPNKYSRAFKGLFLVIKDKENIDTEDVKDEIRILKNLKDEFGRNLAYYAVQYENDVAFEHLIGNGYSIFDKDCNNLSPLNLIGRIFNSKQIQVCCEKFKIRFCDIFREEDIYFDSDREITSIQSIVDVFKGHIQKHFMKNFPSLKEVSFTKTENINFFSFYRHVLQRKIECKNLSITKLEFCEKNGIFKDKLFVNMKFPLPKQFSFFCTITSLFKEGNLSSKIVEMMKHFEISYQEKEFLYMKEIGDCKWRENYGEKKKEFSPNNFKIKLKIGEEKDQFKLDFIDKIIHVDAKLSQGGEEKKMELEFRNFDDMCVNFANELEEKNVVIHGAFLLKLITSFLLIEELDAIKVGKSNYIEEILFDSDFIVVNRKLKFKRIKNLSTFVRELCDVMKVERISLEVIGDFSNLRVAGCFDYLREFFESKIFKKFMQVFKKEIFIQLLCTRNARFNMKMEKDEAIFQIPYRRVFLGSDMRTSFALAMLQVNEKLFFQHFVGDFVFANDKSWGVLFNDKEIIVRMKNSNRIINKIEFNFRLNGSEKLPFSRQGGSLSTEYRVILTEREVPFIVPFGKQNFHIILNDIHEKVVEVYFPLSFKGFYTNTKEKLEWVRREKGASNNTLNIKRNNLFVSSVHQLKNRSNWGKGNLSIKFVDLLEKGAGIGVYNEYFYLLQKEMTSFKTSKNESLFSIVDATKEITMNTRIEKEDVEFVEFCGQIFGRSILYNHCLNANVSMDLVKHILSRDIELEDLRTIDKEFHRHLTSLLKIDDCSSLDMNFVLFENGKEVELIENGKNVDLTNDNRELFISSYFKKRFSRDNEWIKFFLQGFYSVIPKERVRVFRPDELKSVLSGETEIDVDDMEKNTQYVHNNSSVIPKKDFEKIKRWFWDVMKEQDNFFRSRVLQFITGSKKIPMGDFSSFGKKIRFLVYPFTKFKLPTSHICSFQVEIPNYPRKKILEKALSILVNNDGFLGFSFV